MSLTSLGYNTLVAWPPRTMIAFPAWDTSATNTTIDAANEEVHLVGHILLPSGTSSATFDTNTTIGFRLTASCVFANAGTTLRIGVQDVDTTTGVPGHGDDTFDCYADYVGGTDTLTSSAWNTVTMETGSKTVSNNDLIAIVFKLTARAGSDSVPIAFANTSSLGFTRYMLLSDTGSGMTVRAGAPVVAINFNGTWATLAGTIPYSSRTNVTFNSGSAADELGNLFTLPFACNICGVNIYNIYGASSTTFDIKGYTSPLSSPAAISGFSLTVDTDTLGSASGGSGMFMLASPVRVEASTQVAVTITPASTTNVGCGYISVPTSTIMGLLPAGLNCTYCSRADGTGAFTEINTSRLLLELLISDIDLGSSASPRFGDRTGGLR